MGDRKLEEKVEHTDSCSECGSPHLFEDDVRGELVCEECGLVLEDYRIDQNREWSAYNKEEIEKRARTGPPSTLTRHDKGLTTEIDWKNIDASGKRIVKDLSSLYRIRRMNKIARVSNSWEKNLVYALSILNKFANSPLSLPKNIVEGAALIYRNAAKQKLVRGRSIEGMAAASLYAACRQYNFPRTLDEIATACEIQRKQVGRNYRHLTRKLQLKLPPTSPFDYISRICSSLSLSEITLSKTKEILESAQENGLLDGRGPVSEAAAAIYIAGILCSEKRTQSEVANVSGVTEVTVRNRYKELSDKLNIEVSM